jgi:beta-lactamase class A
LSISIILNLCFFFISINKPNSQNINSYHLTKNKTPFIDSSTSNNTNPILQYNNLKPLILSEIETYDDPINIGFFLQDTETGAYLGINEKEGFHPASLLKIPVLMAIFKRAERNEIKLNDLVTIMPEDLDQNYGQLYKEGAGSQHSYINLAEYMILNSDNTAKNALRRQLSNDELNAVFTHMGIPNPYFENNQLITPRDYNRFFKSLYFSTFINQYYSEKILDLATDTQTENLLSRFVPPEIQISHKFGERPDGLSDCGIIYEPKNPYFLCIMTKNIPIIKAGELIAKLSAITYQHISHL